MIEQAILLNQKTAEVLGKLRNDKGLSMDALADATGETWVFVEDIELQHRKLDIGEFIHYCEAMKQDPAEVLTKIMTQ